MSGNQLQMFGGQWTDEKLRMLGEYLKSYTTALKNQPFNLTYMDAFAGTGYRERRESSDPDQLLLPHMSDPEPQGFLDGSARIALQTEPAFDRYVFVEAEERRFNTLTSLKEDFPERADRIRLIQADCNRHLQELCAAWDTKNDRAVLFLDPYGMQVDWTTMEAIVVTRSIDVWILFPLGIAVNRLLRRDGRIPDQWRDRLDRLFGTAEWFDAFYHCEGNSLFGEGPRTSR